MQLPPQQVAVLEASSADEPRRIADLAAETERPPETVTGAAFELADAGLVDVVEEAEEDVELTDEGREYAEDGLPEVRLYEAALELGADDTPDRKSGV